MIMLLHLTRVDDVMCFKRISFLFLVQKKRLEVNVGDLADMAPHGQIFFVTKDCFQTQEV